MMIQKSLMFLVGDKKGKMLKKEMTDNNEYKIFQYRRT